MKPPLSFALLTPYINSFSANSLQIAPTHSGAFNDDYVIRAIVANMEV
jgi:hypothetical protein